MRPTPFYRVKNNQIKSLFALIGGTAKAQRHQQPRYIVGSSTATSKKTQAVLWGLDRFSPPTPLGFLPTGDYSEAAAINSAGQIVGHSTVIVPGSGTSYRAFLYDSKATPPMQDLGILKPGTASYATAINDSGQIVGYIEDGAAGRAFPLCG